jgi:hypothetical protein
MFDEDVWTIVILLDKEFDVVRPAGVRLVARVASLKIGRLRQQLEIGRCGRSHIRWTRRHFYSSISIWVSINIRNVYLNASATT